MDKYRIICYEGNEGVGKSSLKQAFEKSTNFRHLCIDRMFITSIVYNSYKGRHPDIQDQLYEDLDKFINVFNPLFVVLNVDEEVQKERFEKRGDWYIESAELPEIQQKYDEVVGYLSRKYPDNFVILENNFEDSIEKNIIAINMRLK